MKNSKSFSPPLSTAPCIPFSRADEARRAATDILSKATGIVSKLEDASDKQLEAERAINATDDKMTQVHSHMAQVSYASLQPHDVG